MDAIPKVTEGGDWDAVRQEFKLGGVRLYSQYIGDTPRDGIFLECEIARPPSQQRRQFNLYLDEETATALFHELKQWMADVRASNGVRTMDRHDLLPPRPSLADFLSKYRSES